MARHWSPWASLGRPPGVTLSQPFVQRNQDGRLEVFAVGDGVFFNKWQVAANVGWVPDWNKKGKPSADTAIVSLALGRNPDGALEVFAIGDDHALWHNWQEGPNLGWAGWATLGTPPDGVTLTERLAVGRNEDGRQEVYVLGEDGALWHLWQVAPKLDWSAWQSLGNPEGEIQPSSRLTVGQNQDGRQEVFVADGEGAIWHAWQRLRNGSNWAEWDSLGRPPGTSVTDPVVQRNQDGRLEVFVLADGVFFNKWQVAPNVGWTADWNKKGKPSRAVKIVTLAVGRNDDGALEVFGVGDDDALWRNRQVAPNLGWGGWCSLGTPADETDSPVELRSSERMTIGQNQDGRLEIFAIGKDAGVWHVWQI